VGGRKKKKKGGRPHACLGTLTQLPKERKRKGRRKNGRGGRKKGKRAFGGGNTEIYDPMDW